MTPRLAPYAADAFASRGRVRPEAASPTRSAFQRDRDRIIHSTAFRRLMYKTQVFVFHEGDHFRTRLTHSLEVAQIARSVCRTLRLDEDLAEALALAHDLGHTPFGHAGERALDAAMAGHGGFDHNAQSLRIVTRLERKYAAFDGLNLTWETLEGLAKHNGPLVGADGAPLDEDAVRGLPEVFRQGRGVPDLALGRYASLEAQVAALADDIAYNAHDIEDGFRAGFFTLDDVCEVPLVGELMSEVSALYPGLEPSRAVYELNRRLITGLVDDLVAETSARIAALAPDSVDAIRDAGRATAAFSQGMRAACEALRAFLMARVYRHPRINRIMGDAEAIVADLFSRYMADDAALPRDWRPDGGTVQGRARKIADFLAGQTDRYAIEEHRRLFDATPDLR